MQKTVLSLFACALLGACATALSVRELPRREQPGQREQLPVGFAYTLPAAELTATGSITLTACEVDEETNALLSSASETYNPPIRALHFAVKGDIAASYVAGERVIIDYRKMAAFLKTGDLAFARYPNGTLKSINAQIADETPEALASVAAAAGAVTLMVTAPPVGAVVAPTLRGMVGVTVNASNYHTEHLQAQDRPSLPVRYLSCSTQALDSLAAREASMKALAASTLERSALVVESGRLAGLPNLSKGDTEKLAKLRDGMVTTGNQIDKLTVEISKIDASLSLPIKLPQQFKYSALLVGVTAAPDALETAAFIKKISANGEGKVFETDLSQFKARACLRELGSGCAGPAAFAPIFGEEAKLTYKAQSIGQDYDKDDGSHTPHIASVYSGKRSGVAGNQLDAPSDGIIYVDPAQWHVTITAPSSSIDKGVVCEKVVGTRDLSIPQMGTYISLPVHAGFGQKVGLEATFNADGSLDTAHYKRPTSAGRALADSLAGAAKQAQATMDAQTARRAKATADRLAAADAAVKIEADRAALDPTALTRAERLAAEQKDAEARAAISAADLKLYEANAKLKGEGGTPRF